MISAFHETRVLVVTAEDRLPPGADTDAPVPPCMRYYSPAIHLEARRLNRLSADHVRVEVLYAGVCGTDLHLLQSDPKTGYVLTSAPVSIPFGGRVIGHEGVGRVVATGDRVVGLHVGDIVSFASIIACMRCSMCRRGSFNQCSASILLGMQVDGLFGTVVDVPASLAHDVTSVVETDEDLQAVACLEPAGVALLACENARVAAGDSVVVFGGGPIGLYCAILCKQVLGAAHVSLVEPITRRRGLAGQWCDATYDVEEYFSTRHLPVDVVIECSGDLSNVNRVFSGIGARGRVVLLGRGGAPLTIDAVDHMITQAIVVSGSRGHLGGVLSRALGLYHSGRLPLGAVITERLDSIDALYSALRNPDRLVDENCKVLVKLNNWRGS